MDGSQSVTTYDAIVVGWGKGGKTLAAFLAGRGKRVLMIEQSERMYGGTCINIACVPTKALVESANHPKVNGDASTRYLDAIERKNALTGLLRGKNFHMVDDHDTATVITGRARFVGSRELEVTAGDETVRVRGTRIFVNTGAEPVLPPIPGIDGPRVFTSTSLIDQTALPTRLVVLGAGPVGLELAAVYAKFGARVSLVDKHAHLLPEEDRDVAEAVRAVLEDDGIRIVAGAQARSIDDAGTHAIVHVDQDGRHEAIETDAVLVALGRRPNTAGLGLEQAGIDVTAQGAVAVDEHLRASAPGVWALGDVNGGPQFTYVSLDDFRIIRDQLAGPGHRSTSDRVAVPRTTFITPPLASVGLTERAAIAAGHAVKVAMKKIDTIAAMPRARIVGDTRGLIKVIVDGDTNLILGATLFCIDSQEIINLVALAMRHGITATELRDTIYTHPSSTEALNEVLGTI